jgi:hypothetical protein
MKKSVRLFFLAAAFPCCLCTAQSGLSMFDSTYVHEIRVYFDDPAFWETLTANYLLEDDGDPNTVNIPIAADVRIDGNLVQNIGIKQKGYFSNWGSGDALKKPLKLDFNEFEPGGEYDNLKSLNLQNAFMDPSLMRDMLSYRILRDFGVAAPRSTYAKVYLNDQYWGLYVAVESVNKTFLKEHFGNKDGNLYKANWAYMEYKGDDQNLYADEFELKTNEDVNDWSRLVKFMKIVKNTPLAKFRDSLTKYMAVDGYLRALAVDVTTNNWDSHFDHGRNFYLYDNPEDGKFHWIPWDYNLSFGFYDYDITFKEVRNTPSYDKILPRRVMSSTSLRQMYLNLACQLHHSTYRPEVLEPIIDYHRDLIEADLAADENKFYDDIEMFHQALEGGFSRTKIDSFHVIDSTWNGSMWVPIDTFITFEYQEVFRGIKDMVTERNEAILDELATDFNITSCTSAADPAPQPTPELSLSLWPNPASEYVQIRLPGKGQLSIYDDAGRVRMRGQFEGNTIKMPLAGYTSGTYWVEYRSDQGATVQKLALIR